MNEPHWEGETIEAPEPFAREIQELEAHGRIYSYLRLIFFVGFVSGLFLPGDTFLWALALSFPSAVAFTVVFLRHDRVRRSLTRLRDKQLLGREREARRLHRRFRHRAPLVPDHPLPLERGRRVYTPEPETYELDNGLIDDLQLLEGQRSLFGLIDASSTAFGAWRLRHMMTALLLKPEMIRQRQEAVKELLQNPSSQEGLLELLVPLRQHSFTPLPRRLAARGLYAKRHGLALFANLLGTFSLVLLIASFFSVAFLALLVPLLAVNLGCIGFEVKRSNTARDRILLLGHLLSSLLELREALSQLGFEAKEWRQVANALEEAHSPAARLGLYHRLLQLHDYGILFEIWNVVTLWELRILPWAERLIEEHRDCFERALGALGETEAFLSLARPLFEQEGYTFPEPLDKEDPSIEAQELGHPLIEGSIVVRNQVRLGTEDNVWIVTGSNMAGKSTYLKSVACNVVLAGIGAPVCARSFAWTPLRLYSDINIRDSLDDGKSYFRVEIERVFEVVRAARETSKLLVIFDELFRGTNSVERLAISRAILRELRSTGVLVLVATHDLSLTHLVTRDSESRMANYHFREIVEGDTMAFDFRLLEGPAQTRNAIRALEAIGYPEDIIRSARKEAGET